MMDDFCPYLRDEWDDRKGMTPLIVFGRDSAHDGWHLPCIIGMNETMMDDICYVF